MTMMVQLARASEALRKADGADTLEGALTPGMFGCPDCRTAWIVASALPLGRCGRCGAQMKFLNARHIPCAVRSIGG